MKSKCQITNVKSILKSKCKNFVIRRLRIHLTFDISHLSLQKPEVLYG